MGPHLVTLVAALGTLVCGFAYQSAGAADGKATPPEPTGSIDVEVKGTLVCKGIGKAYVSVCIGSARTGTCPSRG
jgi:hypothetical protein